MRMGGFKQDLSRGGRRLRSAPSWLLWSCAALVVAGLLVLVIWVLPLVLTQHPQSATANDRYKAINDTRTGLVALIVAVGAAGGLAYTARTFRLSQQGHDLSRQGQVTDRYAKSIELLGDKERVEVRVGGIYALERLMRDSPEDQPTIMEVLAAYIREHAPTPRPSHGNPVDQQTDQDAPASRPGPATDVQAALTVLGRRTPVENERSLDLTETYLENANLLGANLAGAYLTDANLAGAYLAHANLAGAHLEGANLAGAYLAHANLAGANLEGASIAGVHVQFHGAGFLVPDRQSVDVQFADFEGAHLEGAHLLSTNVTQRQLDVAILDDKTVIPPRLRHPARAEKALPDDGQEPDHPRIAEV